jgi:hypothetical protein
MWCAENTRRATRSAPTARTIPFDSKGCRATIYAIDDGIASLSAALGDTKDLAPFFRIPGLYRTDEIDHELAVRSLVTFSADIVADDWHRHTTPAQIIKRAMSRLEKRGKGSILLLHDIHRQRSLPCQDS